MSALRTAAVALAALALPAAASAGVDMRGADASSFPRAQVTVVTSKPSRLPPQLTENGVPATGMVAENLGRQKSVVLCVDNSQSMKGKSLKNAIAAARAFAADKALNDRVAVCSFGSRAIELNELTSASDEATSSLSAIRLDKKQGTALYDAVVLAAHSLTAEQQGGHVILLVTDGRDVSSQATFADAVNAARKASALIYTVGIDGKQFTPGPIRALANRTGGSYRLASASDLGSVYAEIARELERTWRLDFITAGRPGERTKLTAFVPGEGKASARLAVPASASLSGPGGLLPEFAYGRGGLAGLAMLVGLLVLLAYALVNTSTSGDRLRARVARHVIPKPKRAKKEKKERLQSLSGLFQATENALGHTRFWLKLRRLLERADLPLKTAELFYMMATCALLFVGFGLFVGFSKIFLLGALAFGALLPVAFVWFKARKRLNAFENQLPDILLGIAASLKAGHSFKQGLQAVVDEGHDPAGKEFKRVLTEARLGRPLEDALGDMADRIGSKNLAFIVTAVSIQTQVGGSLAGIFDMVADTVRNRQQFARKIKALTAMGRMSAYVLCGLPFFLAGALTLLNPEYMRPLYNTSSGHTMIMVALVMMAVGSLFLKKIVSFKG